LLKEKTAQHKQLMRQTEVERNFIQEFEDKDPKELQLNDNFTWMLSWPEK